MHGKFTAMMANFRQSQTLREVGAKLSNHVRDYTVYSDKTTRMLIEISANRGAQRKQKMKQLLQQYSRKIKGSNSFDIGNRIGPIFL